MKVALLAATAVIALTAGGAMAGSVPMAVTKVAPVAPIHTPGATTLYNQNSNFSASLVSDNFTSGSFGTIYNSSGADDFVVPSGSKWKITEVDVTGVYFNCTSGVNCGPATSEVITFYKNSGGMPGAVIGTAQTVSCSDSSGSFACKLTTPVKLKGGTKGKTYWVGVVANQDFGTAREWGWTVNTTIHGNEAQWQNPGGGFGVGCTTWGPIGTCLGFTGDFAFDLKGKSL